RADRVIAGAALRGTPRSRFVREQNRLVVGRVLPTLAMVAVATGAAPVADLFRTPPAPRIVTLTQGITATLLACLVFGCTRARKNHAALMTLAFVAGCVTVFGWAIVTARTGGMVSPYVLSVPLGLAVLVIALPLLPWHPPALSLIAAATFWFAAPG